MKVAGARFTVIDIPLNSPYVSSQSHSGKKSTARLIVELVMDDGTVGLGETTGAPEVVHLVETFVRRALGHDTFDLRGLRRLLIPNQYGNVNGRNGWIAFAGIEMACWDAVGKAYGAPLWRLLGGVWRDRVTVAGLMSAFPMLEVDEAANIGDIVRDPNKIANVVEVAQRLVERYGFEALKIKSTGIDWHWDVAVMRALREAFGPRVQLRLDPNAAFQLGAGMRLADAVRGLDLEYLEDPVRGLDAMRRLRREYSVPLATNMCVIDFEQLPLAVRAEAIDVVLGDVYHWAGILGFSELASVCRVFDIDLGIHSFVEAGIGAAVNLHLGASLPALNRAIDGMLHFQDDSIVLEPLDISEGAIALPTAPGIGVSLNEEVVHRLTIATTSVEP